MDDLATTRDARQREERNAIMTHLSLHPLPCGDYRTCCHVICEGNKHRVDALRAQGG